MPLNSTKQTIETSQQPWQLENNPFFQTTWEIEKIPSHPWSTTVSHSSKGFWKGAPRSEAPSHRAQAATPESVGGRQHTHQPMEPAPTSRELKAYVADQTQKTEQFETELD